jgi:hypothetical protein
MSWTTWVDCWAMLLISSPSTSIAAWCMIGVGVGVGCVQCRMKDPRKITGAVGVPWSAFRTTGSPGSNLYLIGPDAGADLPCMP